ncbi:MBL fold metallo-hydrolase [Tsuneonella sp. YG55]|uniref:MBL fold metallo-hydrolase n=1 Tax=Tsuneonella litorea TaxID=2976475 RepID=A0A9X2VYF7_9SPHN|nr:MBL fold metallo-hydrolase [Tsuneonella litorea]MCT2557600.1 MBL fold metallo-hydrolase [Tsuneonella litorea]
MGTGGGPTPKANRAASANAVVVGGRAYLVDAGNGVARQMALAGIPFDSLAAVMITHHHSDHNIDAGALLLLAWAATLSHPIEFHGPPPLAAMLRDTLRANRADIAVRRKDEGRVDPATLLRVHEHRQPGLVYADDRVRVTAALVEHPPMVPSFAYRFDCPDRSVVFSGDTRPSDALVELARGADILVHEVMHLPAIEPVIASEPNAARLREHLLASHTSSTEVGKLASRARVRTLVLSHFVPGGLPGVPDAEWLAAVRPDFAGEIVLGRDLMVL